MLLIPAIDLKEGKCVRLRQGRMDDDTVFSDDPVAVAGKWVAAGAKRIHLVDLDGAFAERVFRGTNRLKGIRAVTGNRSRCGVMFGARPRSSGG